LSIATAISRRAVALEATCRKSEDSLIRNSLVFIHESDVGKLHLTARNLSQANCECDGAFIAACNLFSKLNNRCAEAAESRKIQRERNHIGMLSKIT
jgi:hypothetical protein